MPTLAQIKAMTDEENQERAIRDGLRFNFYDENACPNCGRYRVGLRKNGYSICEKCCWNVQLKQYDGDALRYN